MRKVTLPTLPINGGCQCGAVRYSITGRPIVFYLCHCTECQRHTSSAFGESLRLRRKDLAVEGGMSRFTRMSESGKRREGYFCPQCGVRIVHGTAGSEQVNIKAGTLDDTSWLAPAGHIWTASKQKFVTIGDDEPCWDHQPDDGYAALIARWDEMIAGS
ncbi:GFA family protein [Mesorhizobium sp. Z1-4]|uniref:GFA family protein n=1 Tax=Mesorhizobium sp. Z1-4 TaxID=2448478 RepID=UPI000FD89CEF|nr:GFA family protein [Mesorhizobium sp. Z1-4]